MCGFIPTAGSNPALSANYLSHTLSNNTKKPQKYSRFQRLGFVTCLNSSHVVASEITTSHIQKWYRRWHLSPDTIMSLTVKQIQAAPAKDKPYSHPHWLQELASQLPNRREAKDQYLWGVARCLFSRCPKGAFRGKDHEAPRRKDVARPDALVVGWPADCVRLSYALVRRPLR